LGWDPLPFIDEPSLSIAISVILFGWATLQFNVFYLLPVASDVIIHNMQNGVIVTGVDGVVIFSNPAICREFGKREGQLLGQPLADLLGEWLPEARQAWIEGKQEAQLTTQAPSPQYFQMTIAPLVGNSGDSLGSLLSLHDVSEQKNYENRLRELAIADPLTGCYNRRYFYEMAHSYFEHMRRSARPLSILMLDLDHFKYINDTYGHLHGDRVLQKVAAACKSRLRAADIFARFGGEEFVLAMPDTNLREAAIVAERLRAAIEKVINEPDQIAVTASIGVVESTQEPGLVFDDLLKRADEAMYHSKHAGRNQVTLWTQLHKQNQS
jgi:diguanylate cyclase (GGDEF)-like protein/PAS domain S-box-containing protein